MKLVKMPALEELEDVKQSICTWMQENLDGKDGVVVILKGQGGRGHCYWYHGDHIPLIGLMETVKHEICEAVLDETVG